MPTEPERDIEKTLRAYAKKRREEAGAPAEMHPAARRLLQGEAARLRGGTTPAKVNFWMQLFGGSWQRMAVNLAVFTVLAAVAALLMLPSLSRSKMQASRAMAEHRLRDAEYVNGNKNSKLALNSAPAPAEVPLQQRAVEGELADKAAAKQAPLSYGATFALKETEAQKKTESDNLQLAANAPAPASSLGLDKDLSEKSDLRKQPLLAPAPTASAPANFADSIASARQPPADRRSRELTQTLSPNEASVALAPPPAVTAAPAVPPPDAAGLDTGVANHAVTPAPATLSANSWTFGSRTAEDGTDVLKIITNSFKQQSAQAEGKNKITGRLRSLSRVVLRSFRVEQTGNQIRFIDSDGSVYAGVLELSGQDRGESGRLKEKVMAAPGAVTAAGEPQNWATNSISLGRRFEPRQYFYFRVSGTNLSLRQPVLFNGNFIPNTSPSPSANFSGGAGGGGSNASTPTAGPAVWPLLNSPIQGRLVIGGSNQLEIKALPVKR